MLCYHCIEQDGSIEALQVWSLACIIWNRITHKAGGKYVLGQNEYDSLDALIKAHKKELYLETPLTGSRYEAMFIAYDKKLATQGYMDTDQIKHK